ncbi:MAG: Uma2 family endonuclease [Chloroflexi bacterium]|nr:Uma2 family endonuclease [Chloroflexota bacterium]MCC6892978.1 Uma2 family endonuclease [Anaerolineae bacterium]
MLLHTPYVTEDDFNRFVMLPENRDRNFEYIAGEIVEVVSNSKSSSTAGKLFARIGVHVDDNHLGRVTGADGGYMIFSEKYIPDAAFISYKRQPVDPEVAYNPIAPDLAVEVLSPGNTETEMIRKIGNYLAAGTVLWVADYVSKTIDVYIPNQPRKTLRVGDFLEGGDVLPGFRLAVANIFSD